MVPTGFCHFLDWMWLIACHFLSCIQFVEIEKYWEFHFYLFMLKFGNCLLILISGKFFIMLKMMSFNHLYFLVCIF